MSKEDFLVQLVWNCSVDKCEFLKVDYTNTEFIVGGWIKIGENFVVPKSAVEKCANTKF